MNIDTVNCTCFFNKNNCFRCVKTTTQIQPENAQLPIESPLVRPMGKTEGSFNGYRAEMLVAATITIGKLFYFKKSAYDQYRLIKQSIKEYAQDISQHGGFLEAYFEYTKAGHIHAHMLIYPGGTYQSVFIKHFAQYGMHNKNDKSYTPCQDIQKYREYITKDIDIMLKDKIYPYQSAFHNGNIKHWQKRRAALE